MKKALDREMVTIDVVLELSDSDTRGEISGRQTRKSATNGWKWLEMVRKPWTRYRGLI